MRNRSSKCCWLADSPLWWPWHKSLQRETVNSKIFFSSGAAKKCHGTPHTFLAGQSSCPVLDFQSLPFNWCTPEMCVAIEGGIVGHIERIHGAVQCFLHAAVVFVVDFIEYPLTGKMTSKTWMLFIQSKRVTSQLGHLLSSKWAAPHRKTSAGPDPLMCWLGRSHWTWIVVCFPLNRK